MNPMPPGTDRAFRRAALRRLVNRRDCRTLGHYVYGTRGDAIIDAHGRTSAEAWQAALEQAEGCAVTVEGMP